MAIRPFTFEHMLNTAGLDAKIYHALGGKNSYVVPGYGNEFAATSQGLKILVDTGWLICFGRNIQNDSIEELAVPANTTGYITVSLDMTKENIPHGNWWDSDYTVEQNQVKLEVRSDLIWSSPSNDDQQFTFPLYSYKSTDTTTTLTKYTESFNNDPYRTVVLYDAKEGEGGYWTGGDIWQLGKLDDIEEIRLTFGYPQKDSNKEWNMTQYVSIHKSQILGSSVNHIPLISRYSNNIAVMTGKIFHFKPNNDGTLSMVGDIYNSDNVESKRLRIRKAVLLKGRWHEV